MASLVRKFLVLIFILSLPGAVNAATHTVPGGFSRITDALTAASNGDTILVGPGIYRTSTNGEPFPIDIHKQVLLQGAGMLFTTVDAEGQHSVFRTFTSGIRITGFEITGGAAVSGGGVAVVATDSEIDHNLIIENTATDQGAGIFISAGGNPYIHHNVVWQNTDGDTTDVGDPHGILAFRAMGTLDHNLVGRTDGNGIFFGAGSNLTIRNNILYQNGKGDRGRGICALDTVAAAFVIKHNLFWENVLASLLYRTSGGGMNFTAQQANDYDPADAVYGNIDADPLFLDPDNQSWHLQSGSPAINAGDPALPLDPDGTVADIGPFYYNQVVGIGDTPVLPTLLAGYPNPFRHSVRIAHLALEREDQRPVSARMEVFDMQGRHIKTLWEGADLPDRGALIWDGRDAAGRATAPGVYFVRMQTPDGSPSQSLKLVRLP